MVERLIDHGGRAIGRDEQSEEGRLFRLLGIAILLIEDVLHLVLFVLLHRFAVLLPEFTMQRRSEMTAQGEPSFASRCLGGDV